MLFDNFSDAWWTMLWSVLAIAIVMGAVANKTNFCTMGAVSDWVNMGDKGRIRAWLLAIAVAIIAVMIFEATGTMSANGTFPPYRGSTFQWFEYMFGGLLFGIGMTLASGCGNKTLIRIGGGNIKSLMVMLVIGVIAYFMVYPFPGSDKTLMSVLFQPWVAPLRVSLSTPQDIGSLISAEHAGQVRLYAGIVIALVLLVIVFKSAEFRRSFDNILGGLVIGLAVAAAWYVTGSTKIEADELGEKTIVTMPKFVSNWGNFVEEPEEGQKAMIKPAEARSLGTQSFTFINPMGQTIRYGINKAQKPFLTFGTMALFGVILGSLLWSLLTRSFRIEWFASFKDFVSHFIGAILMGFGGVLALGCTIGQAITGVSTLAIGSFIVFISIVFGSAITMKVQLYRMMYEDASFVACLVTGLVDMKLLPKGMRKLEGI
jgi:uncharacterized membrane protein YedE/YeeE